MSPSAKHALKLTTDDISDGDTYAKLSSYTLRQWGYNTRYSYSSSDPNWGGECGDGDESDEEMPVWMKEGYHNDWDCKLCAKLGMKEQFHCSSILGAHMKTM